MIKDNNIKNPILLFDGVCNMCNSVVQIIITKDKYAKIHYASLQSEIGKKLMTNIGKSPKDLDTVILIEGDKHYIKSDAFIRITHHLGGIWKMFGIIKVIPRSIRDTVYDWIAKNRYRLFGRKSTCMMPRPEWQDRFIS